MFSGKRYRLWQAVIIVHLEFKKPVASACLMPKFFAS